MQIPSEVKQEAIALRPIIAAALKQIEEALAANGCGKANVSIVIELPKSKQVISLSNCAWQVKVCERKELAV